MWQALAAARSRTVEVSWQTINMDYSAMSTNGFSDEMARLRAAEHDPQGDHAANHQGQTNEPEAKPTPPSIYPSQSDSDATVRGFGA